MSVGSDDSEASDRVDVEEDAEEEDDKEDSEEDPEETLEEMAKPRPRKKTEKEPPSQRQIERWAEEKQALEDEAVTWYKDVLGFLDRVPKPYTLSKLSLTLGY